jgi:hypothetical protein
VFMASSVFFLRRISKNGVLLCLCSLLLFQKTYISGYYPNSSIPAAAALSVAMLLATWSEGVGQVALAGVLFAFSFWIRFDTILMLGGFAA